MKHLSIALLFITVFLSGCASQPWYKAPAIADISDSKVVVQYEHSNLPGNIFASKNTATLNDVKRVAQEGCSQYNNKEANLLSETCGRTVVTPGAYGQSVCAATNYLFACKDK